MASFRQDLKVGLVQSIVDFFFEYVTESSRLILLVVVKNKMTIEKKRPLTETRNGL